MELTDNEARLFCTSGLIICLHVKMIMGAINNRRAVFIEKPLDSFSPHEARNSKKWK